MISKENDFQRNSVKIKISVHFLSYNFPQIFFPIMLGIFFFFIFNVINPFFTIFFHFLGIIFSPALCEFFLLLDFFVFNVFHPFDPIFSGFLGVVFSPTT